VNITFKKVTTAEQVEKVVQLANEIWMEHYKAIICEAQVD
jgi:hypothetical protein